MIIIKNTDPNRAINVIGEAAGIYWEKLKDDVALTKRTSIHQLRMIFETCVEPAIQEVRRLDREGRNLQGYTEIELLNELIKRNDTTRTPTVTSWGEGMREALVAVGNDETASIFLHEDAIEYMNKPVDNQEEKK